MAKRTKNIDSVSFYIDWRWPNANLVYAIVLHSDGDIVKYLLTSASKLRMIRAVKRLTESGQLEKHVVPKNSSGETRTFWLRPV